MSRHVHSDSLPEDNSRQTRMQVYKQIQTRYQAFKQGNASRTKIQEYISKKNNEQTLACSFSEEKDVLSLKVLC